MTRYSSAVVISALGLGVLAHGGCTSGDDDKVTSSSSGGTAPTSTTTGGIIGGNGGTGTNGSSASGGTSSGGTGTSGVLEACEGLVDQLPCGADELTSEKKEVNMLLVLDKSGSMLQMSNEKEKWSAMKDALQTALGQVEDEINFGLSLYPYPENPDGRIKADCGMDQNCCEMPSGNSPQVPIEPDEGGAALVDMVLQSLNDTDPGGGTPTAVALEKAYNYFTSGAGSQLSGDNFVLLATDGGPNCNAGLECGADLCTANLDGQDCTGAAPQGNCCDESYAGDGAGCVDDNNVVDQIEALRSAGIDTFVVGIPGSEAYEDFLNDFAVAGGREAQDSDYSYYRVDDVSDLTKVMEKITVSLVTSCDIEVENPLMQSMAPLLAIDCNLINRFEGGGGSNGGGEIENWTWDAESNTIEVQGDLCNQIETEGAGRVDVIFNCTPVE